MKTIIKNVLKPLFLRIGTILATWLISVGVTQMNSEIIVSGFIAASLVSLDLVGDHFFRKDL